VGGLEVVGWGGRNGILGEDLEWDGESRLLRKGIRLFEGLELEIS
jgi:hypothetical protein